VIPALNGRRFLLTRGGGNHDNFRCMFTRHFNRQRYRSLLPNFWQQKVIFLFTYINKKENNRPNFEAPAVVF